MNKNISKEQIAIKIIRWLLFLEGAGWIIFAIVHLVRFQLGSAWMMMVLFIVNAIIFLWLNRIIEERKKWIFYFAVVFIGLNIFLTIVGKFGILDLLVLVLNSFLFVIILGNNKNLLVKTRADSL